MMRRDSNGCMTLNKALNLAGPWLPHHIKQSQKMIYVVLAPLKYITYGFIIRVTNKTQIINAWLAHFHTSVYLILPVCPVF